MQEILKEFKHDKILLIYRCGSRAFGTSTDNSDEDYVVVLRDYRGLTHRSNGVSECFVFGLPFWKDKMEFDDSLADYYLMNNDEILGFPESIVFIDDEIKPLVEEYRSKFEVNYKKWLKSVVNYHSYFLSLGTLEKRFYHLIRIRHIIENYKKSGVFSLKLTKEVTQRILDYKEATNRDKFKNEIFDALEYLRQEAEVYV